jgi:carboxypeptidase C (cathepsin A)
MIRTISAFALTSLAYGYSPEALADQVTNLPGAEALNVTFNQFSGYIAVDGTSKGSKKLHYWLVESEGNPSTDPVTFWTNGGPGCSGLLGFFTEQGPFQPTADMKLQKNEYAWNRISNMVFIEAPCGVGYSYSDDDDDYTTGDATTASDNFMLIQGFLQRFPEFKENPLYITSESYGGHYMPTLASKIVNENKAGTFPKLNFKGFAVGNPYTNVYSGTFAGLATYWGHQLISKPTWDSYSELCIDAKRPAANAEKCEALVVQMYGEIGNLNPYALDFPVCTTGSPAQKRGRAQRHWLLNHMHADASPEMKKALGLGSAYEPCADDYTEAYLNLPEVRKAIHVNSDVKWGQCSRTVRYSTKDSSSSMVDFYPELIESGANLNILVYSGDDDSVCATIGTQSWIWDLGYKVSGRAWRPYVVSDQTAGYLTKWKDTKMALLTVHGAGHEVPTYKPNVALDMFSRYLNGEFTDA